MALKRTYSVPEMMKMKIDVVMRTIRIETVESSAAL